VAVYIAPTKSATQVRDILQAVEACATRISAFKPMP